MKRAISTSQRREDKNDIRHTFPFWIRIENITCVTELRLQVLAQHPAPATF